MHTRNTVACIFLFSHTLFCTTVQKKEIASTTTTHQKKNEHQAPAVIGQSIHCCSTDIKKDAPIKKELRTITVKNAITPEMTKYRFWGTYHTPTKFYISVNNHTVQNNESCNCQIGENNIIEVTYHYEFKNGMVTGSKCIEFEVPTETATVDITFSWNDKHRLMSSTGRAINAKNGTMKSTRKFL